MPLRNSSRNRIYFVLFSILFLLPMCTTLKTLQENTQKRKLERLLDKFSVDSAHYKVDTIFRTTLDTIKIPEISYDTLVQYYLDSVRVIEKDGVRTELKIMKDTFYLQNTVFKRDTVVEYKDTVITIEKIRTVDVTKVTYFWDRPYFKYLTTSFVILILVLIGYILYKKISK